MLHSRRDHQHTLLRLIGGYLGLGMVAIAIILAISPLPLDLNHLLLGWGIIGVSGALGYGLMGRWVQQLNQQQNYIDYLFGENPFPVWVCHRETERFLAVNRAAIATYGYSEAEFLRLRLGDLNSDRYASADRYANADRHPQPPQLYHHTRTGQELTVELTQIPCCYQNQPAQLMIIQDVTVQQQTALALQNQKVQYRILANNVPSSVVLLFDRDLYCTFAAGTDLQSFSRNQCSLEGRALAEALPPEVQACFEPLHHRALAGESFALELPLHDRTYLMSLLPIYDAQGEVSQAMSIAQDITERKRLEAQLHRSAFYDPVTHLPNKTWFLEHLQLQLTCCQAGKTGFFSVFFLELERFNSVKYSLGHSWAVQMMVATAERLVSCLNLADPVARVGDHSLALILTNLYTPLDATAIAEYIHQQLNQPLEIDSQELFSSVAIGIAVIDTPDRTEQSPEDVLQAADTAMNYARTQEGANHAIFAPQMSEAAAARFVLEADLRGAIQAQAFEVYYQPIIALETLELIGFEALMRWQHPRHGWIDPSRFIPVAEETGLMGLIDWWILGEACRQSAQWQKQWHGPQPLLLSVNVSGALLNQFGLRDRLRQVILTNRIPRGSLKLEITEPVLMQHPSAIQTILDPIHNLGIKLAVDDFGTGYSCLESLYHLPIDTIKIDTSFIQDMEQNADHLEIIGMMINLAQSLDIDITAEGIETPGQLARLRSLACRYGQGYLFHAPVPADQVLGLIERDRLGGWQIENSPFPLE